MAFRGGDDSTRTNPNAARRRAVELPRVGSLFAGRFRFKEKLGEGGMGTVFAAEDIAVGQQVAVKIIHPHLAGMEGRTRLRREVQAARTSHPNLVTVYDLHEHGGLTFLVMELVRGESLKARLAREGVLPVDEVVRIGGDVAAGLASLHGRGLVHRDVKPGNILLDERSNVARLCDAGLARPVEQGVTVTETRMVVGTPAYMAPEQATGERLGTAADVYALGIVLHQCLSGEVPLADETALSTLMRRQKRRPPRLDRLRPEVPGWLARLIRKMLDPDPSERPTADEVVSVLERRKYRPLPSRRELAAAAAVMVFLLLCGAAIPMWRMHRVQQVVPSGEAIRGLDGRGRVVWQVPMGPGQHRFLRADVTGDGEEELVAATYGPLEAASGGDGGGWNPGVVQVVDRRGRVLTRFDFSGLEEQEWPFSFPKELVLSLWAADLDGDGASEIVVSARHESFYPQILLLYWPRYGSWRCILGHTGWIYSLAGLPPRGGAIRLAFAGINNRLLRSQVVGVVEVPPEAFSAGRGEGKGSLESLGSESIGAARLGGLRWVTYVPIGFPGAGPPKVRWAEGSLHLQWPERTVQLDRFFNPVPGPNAGRDLRALRLEFFQALALMNGTAYTPSGNEAERRFETLRERVSPLMAEVPYRAILADREAVWLARRGRPARAVEILRLAYEESGLGRLRLHLIDLLAAMGRLDEADAVAWRLLDDKRDAGIGYDVEVLVQRLAMERRDREELRRLVATMRSAALDLHLDSYRSRARYAELLSRRARLWWDELTAGDAEMVDSLYEPAGPAVTVLCRWRLGRIRPEDEDVALRTVMEAAGLDGEGFLALAAARMGLGRPAEALQVLLPLGNRLAREAWTSLNARQLWHLCRALHARALLGTGDARAARAMARELLAETRPGLLPAILAQEVLDEAS
jgi:hypothetical protein